MNRKKITQAIALALCLSTTSSVLAPSITASATEINMERNQSFDINLEGFKNASQIEIVDEYTILIDGSYYNFQDVANVLCEESGLNSSVNTKNAPTVAIKKAAKWIVSNWTTIYNKLPNNVKKYFKIDAFISLMDQFIGISDSIQDFLNSTFRAMGMPEWANWAITNVIMVLLPI